MAKPRALTARKATSLAANKRKRHPNRALTEAEIRLLLNSADSTRDDALIRLGLSVGLGSRRSSPSAPVKSTLTRGSSRSGMRRKMPGAPSCLRWRPWESSNATSTPRLRQGSICFVYPPRPWRGSSNAPHRRHWGSPSAGTPCAPPT